MIGRSISEMIQNGFNRNIVVYDKDSAKLSLRLFALMVSVGKRTNIRIKQFIISESASIDLLEIFQEKPLLFGPPFNFTEKNLTDYKIIGRDLLIVNGLSKHDTNPKYFEYYEKTLRASLLTSFRGNPSYQYPQEEIILGVDENFNCLLGAC